MPNRSEGRDWLCDITAFFVGGGIFLLTILVLTAMDKNSYLYRQAQSLKEHILSDK